MSDSKVRWLAVAYFALAIAVRFLAHGSNINAFVALALFAGCYLSATEGIIFGLAALAVTDTIGHYLDLGHMSYYHRPTMFAVYLATALPGILGWLMRTYEIKWPTVFTSTVAGAVLFYLITNYACWLDPLMQYPQTPAGLLDCYIKALPFAGNHFLSTLLFSGAFFGGYALLNRRALAPAKASGQ